MEMLGENFGQNLNINTCRISNARPFMNIEQLENDRNKFSTLNNNKNNHNRSLSPLKRKSVINYFDEMDDNVRLKSFNPNKFRSSTTSSKPIRYIQKELRRVFNKLSIKNELKDEECMYICSIDGNEEDISFTVEIVNILDFEHLKGINVIYEKGNEEVFNTMHDLILQNLLI